MALCKNDCSPIRVDDYQMIRIRLSREVETHPLPSGVMRRMQNTRMKWWHAECKVAAAGWKVTAVGCFGGTPHYPDVNHPGGMLSG